MYSSANAATRHSSKAMCNCRNRFGNTKQNRFSQTPETLECQEFGFQSMTASMQTVLALYSWHLQFQFHGLSKQGAATKTTTFGKSKDCDRMCALFPSVYTWSADLDSWILSAQGSRAADSQGDRYRCNRGAQASRFT